jgi:predicted permease
VEWRHWLPALAARLRTMGRSRRFEQDLQDELSFHLAMQTQTNLHRGMSEGEANRQARHAMDGLDQAKERCRDVRPLRWARDLASDLRYATRSLRRTPGFTLVAVVTLALGIGANTALFSVVSAVLLQPLPYPDSDRLVRLWSTGQKHPQPRYASALPDHRVWRGENHTFEDIGAYAGTAFTITGTQQAELLEGTRMTANMWALVGARPLVGRLFSSAEGEFGAHRVAVLSERVWRRLFGADPAIVGSALQLDSESFTVVGVLPDSFQFPNERVDLWAPLSFSPTSPENSRRSRFVDQLGRLKPGVTLAQAQADLSRVAEGVAREFPNVNAGLGAALEGWQSSMVASVRPTLWLLFGAVGFVLLIACANVANLFLARAMARQNELAVRAALGAGRGRVIRLLFAESLALASIGTAIGVLLGYTLIRLLPTLGPIGVPRMNEVTMNGWVVIFAVSLAFLTSLIFGLWPARHAGRLAVVGHLNEAARVVGSGRGQARSRSVLVVAEVSLSLVLLIGAALLIASKRRVEQVDPGFQAEHLFTARVTLPGASYPPRERESFFRQLIEQIEAQPAIRAAGATTALPLTTSDWTKYFTIDGRPAPPSLDQIPLVGYRQATPGYFRAMGATLRRGRLFTPQDAYGQPLIAIVNEAIARRFWPNEDPLGKRFAINPPESLMPANAFPLPNGATSFPRITIVGVIADFRQNGLDRDVNPEVFVPHAQAGGAIPETATSLFIVARTVGESLAPMGTIQQAVGQLDRGIALANARSMERRLELTLANRRFTSWLLGGLAALALLLALVGLYGVLAYTIGQRRRELGLRAALGATSVDAMRLVMGDGLRLTGLGIAIGLPLAGALTRLMSAQLFQITSVDPEVYAGASLLLFTIAGLACGVPAFRATRVDPVTALRCD